MESLKPILDWVLILPDAAPTNTASGLYLPENIVHDCVWGEILVTGPGARDEHGKVLPMEVKTGERVYFNRFASKKVKLNRKELLLVSAEDIMLAELPF